jgi:hypothetical protein
VGGSSHLCGTRVVLLKLNQLHVEYDDDETIIHIVKQSRMIDVHGQSDRYYMKKGGKEAGDLFQVIYGMEMIGSLWSVGYTAYDMYRADKRTKKSFLAWISELGQRHPRIPYKLYEPLGECVDNKGIIRTQQDWTELIGGMPETLNIFRSCTVCGVSVSAPWKNVQGAPVRQAYSFQTIRDLSVRQKPPTVLSWFIQRTVNSSRLPSQCERFQQFGIPLFFFRYSFTSDCIDQAYCAFALIPRGAVVDLSCNALDTEVIVRSYTREQFLSPFTAKKIEGINYFVRVCDIIHCRYGLGFDPVDTTHNGYRTHERVTFIPMEYESLQFALPHSGLRQYGYDVGDGEIG